MARKPSASSLITEAAALDRLIHSAGGDLANSLARYVLALGFSMPDRARMSDLAERNQHEQLPAEEQRELQDFVRAGHLLALLQSKARRSMKQAPPCT